MPLPNAIPVEGVIGSLSASSAIASSAASVPDPWPLTPDPSQAKPAVHVSEAMKGLYDMGDAPSCHTCGAIMVRNGSCYRCMSCGSTSGCS
jgi:ribonucleoside-diphosphate reductase alpha chain